MALNKNNSAVKRIMQEARELANDPSTDYSAAPLEDDIFEWHCTLRGPAGTEFEGGLYHFRILLPAEYPFRPPSIMILTPNGRFELNTKICISFTNYHEELWQPAWGVRTAIIGLQGFFPLKGQAAVGVGSIEYPTNERKRLASLSREWTCPICQTTNVELLPDPPLQPTHSENDHVLGTSPPAIDNTPSPSPPSPIATSDTEVVNSIPMPDDVQQATAQVISDITDLTPPGNQKSTPDPADSASPTFLPHSPASVSPQLATATRNHNATGSRQSSQKPPLLLDSAICVLVVLVFTIICRRIV